LARALIEARRRGIAVEVLADREMSLTSRGSRMEPLVAEGIPVRLEFR
jgi:hypothetical protein